MQTFNYHTHTARCGHAYGTDEEYILSAITAGYQILGFSEHLQHRAMSGKLNRINYEDFNEYFETFNAYKELYESKIKILCGLEVAFIPEWLEDIYDIKEKCDYIILGQHIGGSTKWHYNQFCSNEDVLHYATDIEYAVRTGLFSIIAHPDFFMSTKNQWTSQCEQAAISICRISKEYNIPLEINLKGLNSPLRQINEQNVPPYPYRSFWEIAADIGSPVIFGVDAHAPDSLKDLSQYDKASLILKGLKLNYLQSFSPNKPKTMEVSYV